MGYKSLERRLLKGLGARRFVGSGAGLPVEDGSDGRFHIQLKVTRRPFYTLSVKDLGKLARHAFINWQIPLFAIYFSSEGVYVLVYPCECAPGGETVRSTIRLRPYVSPQRINTPSITPSHWMVSTVNPLAAKSFLDSIVQQCRYALELRSVPEGGVGK